METKFIFAACKFGFEQVCTKEVLAHFANLRFAFSRPGFLTFKVVEGNVDLSLLNTLTFVRFAGENPSSLTPGPNGHPDLSIAEYVEKQGGLKSIQHLHWWNRILGDVSDQPRLDLMQEDSGQTPQWCIDFARTHGLPVNQRAKTNDRVLNLIEVDSGKVWAANHRVETTHQRWPGGVIQFSLPENVVSRAYYKAQESIAWSRFPIQPGENCVEVGCAPGGAAQALLESKVRVIGIDPAEMDESVVANPNFVHIKKRGADVRKKELSEARWLFADSNVAPNHTLDTVQEIVTNRHVHIQGLILTLKLMQEKLGDEIEEFRERIREMGFKYVKSKQLAFNRNEVCLVALKRKSILRFGKIRRKKKENKEGNDPN